MPILRCSSRSGCSATSSSPTQRSAASALAANRGLLAYRQVLPVDTVLVRAVTEGSLQLLVGLALLSGAALIRFDVLPHDPLLALEAYLLLWLFGSGLGLALSVGYALVPEIEKIMGFVFMPLYFASGVLFSPAAMPARLQEWLLYNPIVHGLELGRAAFFPGYHLVQGSAPATSHRSAWLSGSWPGAASPLRDTGGRAMIELRDVLGAIARRTVLGRWVLKALRSTFPRSAASAFSGRTAKANRHCSG